MFSLTELLWSRIKSQQSTIESLETLLLEQQDTIEDLQKQVNGYYGLLFKGGN